MFKEEQVVQICTNPRLFAEEEWLREYLSKIDIPFNFSGKLVLDKNMFPELFKLWYNSHFWFTLLYKEGVWMLNNFGNPIMTYEDYQKK